MCTYILKRQKSSSLEFSTFKNQEARLLLSRKYNYASNYRNVVCKYSFINELWQLKDVLEGKISICQMSIGLW